MIEKLKIWIENNHFLLKIIRPIYKNTLQKYFIYKQNKLFNAHNIELLQKINLAFDDLGIDYWLDFGTLLGAIREGEFLVHDRDIDIGILDIPNHVKKDKIFETLSKYGFHRKFYFTYKNIIREETYIYKGVTIDLFYYTKNNHYITGYYFLAKEHNLKGAVSPRRNFTPIKVIFPFTGIKNYSFLNIQTKIPLNTEEYIVSRYGKDYMTPQKNWDNLRSPYNIKALYGEVGLYYKNKDLIHDKT